MASLAHAGFRDIINTAKCQWLDVIEKAGVHRRDRSVMDSISLSPWFSHHISTKHFAYNIGPKPTTWSQNVVVRNCGYRQHAVYSSNLHFAENVTLTGLYCVPSKKQT